MGTRGTKSLKLNGVIVGEYLGSDDFDEDREAARAFLRARGLYNPPSLVSSMLGQANAFAYMANAAYKELANRSFDRPLTAVPFVVNAALSVELHLKTLQEVAGGKVARRHKLLELYDPLPELLRDEIAVDTSRLAPEHGEPADVQFRDLLTDLNDAFEQWRYVYELPRAGPIHFQQTILVMHALRDMCVRTVKT